MWFRRRRIATHATGLWMLVVLGAVLFAAIVGYLATLGRYENGTVTARPVTSLPRLPTAFGKIISLSSEGGISLVSKQAFSVIFADEGTNITSLGGGALPYAALKPGMRITATGKDVGAGKMLAEAIVVIEQNTIETTPATLLQAPEDWKDWPTRPALIGWGDGSSKYVAAVRGYDLKAPAVSVMLYDQNGGLVERIELDVLGYKHLKKLNAFMKLEDAERTLIEMGIQAGTDAFDPTGAWQLEVTDNPRTAKLIPLGGE